MSKKLYKAVVMITFISILAIPNLVSAYSFEYSDVDKVKDKSHYKSIMELTEADIINGYEDETFRPNNKLQRRHAASLIYRALELTIPSEAETILEEYYGDLNIDHEYGGEIAALTPKVFKGSAGSFERLRNMNREQMATVVVRAFELKDNGTNPGIKLSDVSKSHRKNVKILAQHQITDQLDNFRPKEPITRGQFASFIYRTMNKEETVIYESTHYNKDFSKVVDIQANNNPKADGAGQFIASKDLVAYYVNTHNVPKDSTEYFQFLSLSQNAGLDAAEINNNVLKGKGSLEGTGQAFIDSAKKYGINEVYLLSHALHETGNGTSELAQGIKVDGKMTYNMFGIGAIDKCPNKCGSQRAYNEGWFTPEEAIIGGAKFIGQNYIHKGQDTLYKMKWNPDDPYHQYATDVRWAEKQTRRIKNIYDSLDTYFLVFDVSVYDNQPDSSAKPSGEDQYAIDHSKDGTKFQTTAGVNIRTYPWGGIIKTLAKGTIAEVIGYNGGWYKVKASGLVGWVSGDYLEKPYSLTIDVPNKGLVRSKPVNTSDSVGAVRTGDVVTGIVDGNGDFILENDYYKVEFNDKVAWLHDSFVK